MPGAAPWSTSHLATLGVVASGCLPHLPFGAIGPLGPHDAEYTLELQMQPHWLARDLLEDDRTFVEIISQLRFGMWLVSLPAQGDHAVLHPILTIWLTRSLEFCDVFCRWFCSWWPPHILLFSCRFFFANMFMFGSQSCSLVSPSLVWLIFFEIVWMGHVGAQLKISVLADFFLV